MPATTESTDKATNTLTETAQQATDLPAELLRTELEQASKLYDTLVNFLLITAFNLLVPYSYSFWVIWLRVK
jgi:small conductance mechanosensitive channel